MQRMALLFSLVTWAVMSCCLVAEDKSPPEALAMYADAANFQNNGAFDLAVEEWEKFLQKFPNDPLVAKAQHYLGVCSIQTKQYDKAIAAFQTVVTKFTKFESAEEAYLNLGWCQYTLGQSKPDQYPKAVESLGRMLDKFPNGKLADQALYFLAESLYAMGKKPEAEAAYDRLVKDFAKSTLRCDAIYALGVAQEELQKWQAAGASYDLFLKECASSNLVTEVRMRKAETVLQLGDAAAAEKVFAELAGLKEFASADHALFRQAFCLAKLDKFVEAATRFGKLTSDFPKSEHLADATISAGRNYFRAGKFDEAALWLQKSIDLGGEHAPEAAHWICRLHLQAKQPAKVVEVTDKMLPGAASSPFLVALKMDQADGLYELSDRKEEAVQRYIKIAADHAQHELASQALYNAAFGWMELKKYPEAIQQADAFVKAFPNARLLPDARFVRAESLFLAAKLPEAEKAFQELVAAHAEHPDAERWRLRLASVVLRQQKYDEVLAILTKDLAALKNPDSLAEGQFLIGSSQFLKEKFTEASAALTASLAASAKWRQADEVTLLLARTQQKLKQLDAATATVQKFFKDFPESRLTDQAYFRLGEFQYAANQFPAATKSYQTVIDKFPESSFVPYALYGKGWSHMKGQDPKGASEVFGELLKKYPQHALEGDALFSRAMSRRQAGDFAGATADAEAFLKANPKNERVADALYERGLAEVGLKNYPAAISTFGAVLKDHPNYSQADQVLYELAWAHKSHQQAAEAAETFKKLVAGFPASALAAEAHFHVGEDLYEKKNYADAAKEYAEAKKKSSPAELAEKTIYKLGWANFQSKQYAAAAAEFAELIAKFPEGSLKADSTFMRAESLFKQGQFPESFAAFQDAAKVKLSSPQMEMLTALHSGQCQGQLKRWAESITTLSQFVAKFPDSPYTAEAIYEQGWAKQNLGKLDEALKDYEQAATRSRDHVGARARFMMGEILFEKKQFDEAIKQFQRVMFGFGGESASPETKLWQAKAGHEAGRCAEVQIQSTTDAKRKSQFVTDARRYYEYVAGKHPQDNLAGEAKKRLETLKKL